MTTGDGLFPLKEALVKDIKYYGFIFQLEAKYLG